MLIFNRLFPSHIHRFSHWRMEMRILKGPIGTTEDEVMRRHCEVSDCGLVQQKEIEEVK